MQGETQDYASVYSSTVKRIKGRMLNGRNITQEDIDELRAIKKALASQGARTDIDRNIATWGKFCEDIGRPYRTVNRWLAEKKGSKQVLCISKNHKFRSLWWAIRNLFN